MVTEDIWTTEECVKDWHKKFPCMTSVLHDLREAGTGEEDGGEKID